MNTGMYSSISESGAAMKRLDVIANNLANANTIGFKKDRLNFESQLMASTSAANGDQPVLINNSIFTDFSTGPLKQTGNTLDLAIEGDGFFVINTPQGPAYTRQGTFQRSNTGRLVNRDGFELQGTGALNLNGSKIEIDAKGNVMVDGNSAGSLDIVDFPKPYALQKIGDTLFGPADQGASAPQKMANPVVRQGFIEDSNVSVIQEMSLMIEASRYFETGQKVIQAYDNIAGKAANDIGRV